ncbi:uncharacterized protein B0H18DRAFT_189063 [Fomitopsis serialis]|uniref:uncharacterized protein n=1 Tax=Fomitopsis serialis TaxID=139415 RepID=UPI0020075AB6|nr:uncharacterized protein B0H18DRAFT_189063 [Neoantrodia serialis]KAH9937163.1 hypothetical protein B0H18DRAFT_189063 [Neoantrodia serialis]
MIGPQTSRHWRIGVPSLCPMLCFHWGVEAALFCGQNVETFNGGPHCHRSHASSTAAAFSVVYASVKSGHTATDAEERPVRGADGVREI